MGVSDRVVVMSRGRIEQIGTPEEIYRRPATPFVAGFVGRSVHAEAVVDTPPGRLLMGPERLPVLADGARSLLYQARVEAFIRPEDVRLGAEAAAMPCAFRALVTHLEFLGPVCRLSLEVGRLRLEADATPDTVHALRLAPGAEVDAAVPSDRVMVFTTDA